MTVSDTRTSGYEVRVGLAVTELQNCILEQWPDATFRVGRGADDPIMVHLWATVDVEDTDIVVDSVIDRLVQLHMDEGIPIAVIPVRPLARVLANRQRLASPDAAPVAAGIRT